jgi:hypothetical protein
MVVTHALKKPRVFVWHFLAITSRDADVSGHDFRRLRLKLR